MDAYPLRNIPDDLWHAAKTRALADRVSLRDVIELGLQRYAADGFESAALLAVAQAAASRSREDRKAKPPAPRSTGARRRPTRRTRAGAR